MDAKAAKAAEARCRRRVERDGCVLRRVPAHKASSLAGTYEVIMGGKARPGGPRPGVTLVWGLTLAQLQDWCVEPGPVAKWVADQARRLDAADAAAKAPQTVTQRVGQLSSVGAVSTRTSRPFPLYSVLRKSSGTAVSEAAADQPASRAATGRGAPAGRECRRVSPGGVIGVAVLVCFVVWCVLGWGSNAVTGALVVLGWFVAAWFVMTSVAMRGEG